MITSRKIKHKIYWTDKDKNKIKQEASTSDPNRDSQDEKIEDMSRLIRNMSNKLSIFEVEGNNANKTPQEGGPINPN
jgi:hypothetical protein